MKIHIGADVNSGAVHTVTITAANVADINECPICCARMVELFLRMPVIAAEYRRGARHLGMRRCVNDKSKPGKSLSSSQKKRNRKQSSVRARVEHVFREIKQLWLSKDPIVVWRKMHHRSTCWLDWQIYLNAQAAAESKMYLSFPENGRLKEKSG